MSTYYYIVNENSRQMVFLGTGSYNMCHQELFDILQSCKRSGKSIEYVQKKTLDIYYDMYDDDEQVSEQEKYESFYTSRFIPAVYNWFTLDCYLTTDWDFDNILRRLVGDEYYEQHHYDHNFFDENMKCVGSMWQDENEPDSIVESGYSFSTAFAEMLVGKKLYRKAEPEKIYFIKDKKLTYQQGDNQQILDKIDNDFLFTEDWFYARK